MVKDFNKLIGTYIVRWGSLEREIRIRMERTI